ncbi:MAG: class I SAM-dependent methyltransferase [Parasphingopyxis sp.]|nr:hypothetical protein [Sphingomonadales bacterium]
MIRPLAFALAASLIASPAAAWQEQEDPARSILNRILDRVLGPTEQADQTQVPVAPDGTIPLETILAADFRAEDRARDQYRHPAETLAFFQVAPAMTVAEYAPGGGWYTRVLAPYVAQRGRYLAVNPPAGEDATTDFATAFPARAQQWTGAPASSVTAFESDEIPAGLEGSVDRILIFRNIHSLLNGGIADTELRNLRRLLADDGLIGVVQHRAPESEQWERANGSRGYVKQSDVVALFDMHGFELVQSSEINANPRDTAAWDRGVWTLPPAYRLGDVDRDYYSAIGESDRMTLLFRKAD